MRKTTQFILALTTFALLVAVGIFAYFVATGRFKFFAVSEVPSLKLEPASGTFAVGDTVEVALKVNTVDEKLIVIGADLVVDPQYFDITQEDIEKGDMGDLAVKKVGLTEDKQKKKVMVAVYQLPNQAQAFADKNLAKLKLHVKKEGSASLMPQANFFKAPVNPENPSIKVEASVSGATYTLGAVPSGGEIAEAVTNFDPASLSVSVNDIVSLTLTVNTKTNKLTGVEGDVAFDENILEGFAPQKEDVASGWSFLSGEVKAGKIHFAVYSSGGVSGDNAPILVLKFKARKEGQSTLSFINAKIYKLEVPPPEKKAPLAFSANTAKIVVGAGLPSGEEVIGNLGYFEESTSDGRKKGGDIVCEINKPDLWPEENKGKYLVNYADQFCLHTKFWSR